MMSTGQLSETKCRSTSFRSSLFTAANSLGLFSASLYGRLFSCPPSMSSNSGGGAAPRLSKKRSARSSAARNASAVCGSGQPQSTDRSSASSEKQRSSGTTPSRPRVDTAAQNVAVACPRFTSTTSDSGTSLPAVLRGWLLCFLPSYLHKRSERTRVQK